jgi:hypothetical protein
MTASWPACVHNGRDEHVNGPTRPESVSPSGCAAGYEQVTRTADDRDASGRRGGGGRAGRLPAEGAADRVRRVVRRPVPGAWRIHGGPPPRPLRAHRPLPPSPPPPPPVRQRPSACPGRGGRPDGNRQPQDGSRRPGSRTTESRGPGRSWTRAVVDRDAVGRAVGRHRTRRRPSAVGPRGPAPGVLQVPSSRRGGRGAPACGRSSRRAVWPG